MTKNMKNGTLMPAVMDTKEIAKIEKNIGPVVDVAVSLKKITNPSNMVTATELLSQINQYADQIDEKKQEITKPLNTALKSVRGLFAPLEKRLEAGRDNIRALMGQFQTEQVKIQREEEAKLAARVRDGKGGLKAETAARKMDELDKPEQNVVAQSGSVQFRTVRKFKVDSILFMIEKTGVQYILVDEVAVRKAMIAGVAIPGVEYYDEQVPFNTR